jgi:hypothetical protein
MHLRVFAMNIHFPGIVLDALQWIFPSFSFSLWLHQLDFLSVSSNFEMGDSHSSALNLVCQEKYVKRAEEG